MKRTITGVVLMALLGMACSQSTQRMADMSEREGDWDQAVLYYLELVQDQPENISYRAALMRARIRASQMHFELGKEFKEAGVLDQALIELQQAVQLDTTNQYAQVELRKVREQITAAAGGTEILTLEQMKEKVRTERKPPELSPRSTDPISMDFPEPVSVQSIYRALGKAFGINVIFDPNLRDQEIAITLQDVVAKDALEILMRSAGHFYKVVDEHSILIAADTPQNRRAYEDLVIQTFFLSNAQPKDTFNMLRQLVGAKNIATNEELNAIVVRDTADRVKVAERIIQTNDKARGEVVVDVELLQINTNTMLELGMSLSEYQVIQQLEPNPIAMSDLQFINQSNWMLTIPSFIYDFMKSSADAELLARPQLRISDGEQARLHIGDQVPIPVTTFNTANTVGANIVPVTSFSYQDVGIRIDLESRIHHNQEVTLDVHVEVSQVTGDVQGSQGSTQPIISTRNIESTIRLRDGETNFLAGLLRTDEISGKVGIPGLSDIPVLGRIFSKNSNQTQRTDLVITLTPHIVRTADVTEEDLAPIWVGTESNITFRGGTPQIESSAESPFEGQEDSEQLQEMIRERLENLPRGLQDQQQPPQGQAPEPIEAPSPQRNVLDQQEQQDDDPPGAGLAFLGRGADIPGLTTTLADLALAATAQAEKKPTADAPIRMRLRPSGHLPAGVSKLAVPIGQLFAVDLVVQADVEVNHLPIIVGYDPAVLEIDSVYEGDFFGGAGTMLADHTTAGRLVLGASLFGRRPGISGKGTVVTIYFKALKKGRTGLRFQERQALDRQLRPIGPIQSKGLTINADPSAKPFAVPERPERPRVS